MGGLGLATGDMTEGWEIESTQFHGPNLVSYKIISGTQRTPLIGIYLTLTTLDHIPDLEEALNHFLGIHPKILGDLKTDVVRMGNPRYQQVSNFLVYFGLVDLLCHFRKWLRFRNM